MPFRNYLLLGTILIFTITGGLILIWQGFNLDKNSTSQTGQVLNEQTSKETPPAAESTTSAVPLSQNLFQVTKVIDGDTFEIKVGFETEKVRMIGIDTPETVDPRREIGCFGKKASEETKRLIEGKEVILTKDISETDKYGRLLRYVFLPLSGGENLFVNDYLVRQGFAKASTYPPDIKYSERFSQAEKEARDNLRGLWAECR